MNSFAPRPVASRTLRPARALAAALLAGAVALAGLIVAPAAHAAPLPSGPMSIAVHKLEQPEAFGAAASGLELAPDALAATVPVPGAAFTATRVPGIDPASPAGQREAASLTLAAALERVAAAGVAPEAAGTTDAAGDTVLEVAGPGVFVVTETMTPVGYVDAAPFLVVLPMSHPGGDGWLTTVHVYPKNAAIDVAITVDDAAAIGCGDTVWWRTRNAIPRQAEISRYVTQHVIAPGVALDDIESVAVTLSGASAPALRAGDDYALTAVEIDGQAGFEAEFTAAGRAKLVTARAADATSAVLVEYPTRVLTAGEHVTDVRLFVDDAEPVRDSTVTKFGALVIVVHERGDVDNLIADAEFQLFLDIEQARAGEGALTVAGSERWSSDEHGTIVFECLRYSGFVNGLDRDQQDPLFRTYFAAPISYPAGWTGDREPLAGSVGAVSVEDAQTLEFTVWRGVSPAQPIPGLPITGGQLLGGVLLAAALLAAGATIVLRRRRTAAGGQ